MTFTLQQVVAVVIVTTQCVLIGIMLLEDSRDGVGLVAISSAAFWLLLLFGGWMFA